MSGIATPNGAGTEVEVLLVTTVMRVGDLDAAADWYQSALGVSVSRGVAGRHRYGSFELGGGVVSLWELQPGDEPPRGSISDPYLTIVVREGIERLHRRLSDQEVRTDPLLETRAFHVFRFRDLDGNIVEVSQPKEDAPSD